MELLLPFMSVIDMTLKMSFGSKALATVRIRAFVVFCVVALMMFELVRLVKDLVAARLIARVHTILG